MTSDERARATIETLIEKLQKSLCAPQVDLDFVMRSLGESVDPLQNARALGLRVRVKDGSGSKDLGKGIIEDFVTVYAKVDRDGASLQSMRLAEEPFEGAHPLANNPKIRMDDGTVRYGCQVWWEPIKEAAPAS